MQDRKAFIGNAQRNAFTVHNRRAIGCQTAVHCVAVTGVIALSEQQHGLRTIAKLDFTVDLTIADVMRCGNLRLAGQDLSGLFQTLLQGGACGLPPVPSFRWQ